MRKLISVLLCICFMFCLASCGNKDSSKTSESTNSTASAEQNPSSMTENSSASSSTQASSNTQASSSSKKPASLHEVPAPIPAPTTTTVVKPTANPNPKIFLAGDSTVKTYEENQYIGGWGQYLQNFLNAENVTVVNKSNGGRSSRSFINEGRLFTYENTNYGSYTSIESEITSGDYLIIQFGHNDDMTRNNFDTYIERQVPLGEPDKDGIFPTVVPQEKVSKHHLPDAYVKEYEYNQTQITIGYSKAGQYGDYYYSADQGTFKGYLKMYIDFARSKGAIPILATPVARVKLDKDFNLLPGNGRHGPNFEYVTAVRQLAEEENCMLIDLFDFTKQMLETSAKTAGNINEANYLMALKPNSLTGAWPNGYDEAYGDTSKGYTGIEATHYNKYGAYLTAAAVAEKLYDFNTAQYVTTFEESITFGDSILTTPTAKIEPSSKMNPQTPNALLALLKVMKA